MSDTPLPETPATPEPENKLTSAQFDEFKQALEVLYVMANMSGRINFTKAWPEAAQHILGAELIKYDEEGTDDKEHRAELEQQAEERRLSLLDVMDTLEEKSVDKGALQIEYVRGVVERLGRPLALHIYGAQIVDRFIAPLPSEASSGGEGDAGDGAVAEPASDAPPAIPPAEQAVAAEVPEASPIPQQPEVPAANIPLSSMDDVKPIDMSAPASPPPSAPSQTPVQDTPQAPLEAAAPAEQPQAPVQQEPPASVSEQPEPSIAPSPPQAEPSPVQMPPQEAQPEVPEEPKKVEGNVAMTFVSSKKKESGEGSPPPSE